MSKQGLTFKQVNLQYSHNERLYQFNIQNMLKCQGHNIFIAKCKEGEIIGGYLISPSTFYERIGQAILFRFNKL